MFDTALCGGKGYFWGHECKASDVWTLSSPSAKNYFFDFLFPTLLWHCCQETLQMSRPLSVTGKQALNWTFILLSNLLHSKEKATLLAWKWPFGNHWLLKVNYLKLRYLCICIYYHSNFSLIFIYTCTNNTQIFVCSYYHCVFTYKYDNKLYLQVFEYSFPLATSLRHIASPSSQNILLPCDRSPQKINKKYMRNKCEITVLFAALCCLHPSFLSFVHIVSLLHLCWSRHDRQTWYSAA